MEDPQISYYFKMSMLIIILKLNKKFCIILPKFFYPIILMNILGKLIEKVIGERMQFYFIFNNFIHSNQLRELKCQDRQQWTLSYFFSFLLILFFLFLSFLFLFLEQLGLGIDWSRYHISHKLMAKSQD